MSWAIFLGAFVGSLIELVEVLAMVLVVGWVAALVVGSITPVAARPLELLAGVILLAFGQAWARSVTKYYGGSLSHSTTKASVSANSWRKHET